MYRQVSAYARELGKSELMTWGYEDDAGGVAFSDPGESSNRGAPRGRTRDERGVPRGNWDGANLPERAAKGKPQQPFGDSLEFKEADIPF